MMLQKLTLNHFTIFNKAIFRFVDGLNVIVGDNGLGKSHILKAAYAVISVSFRGARDTDNAQPTKSYLSNALAKKLIGVFRPDQLGRLASRRPGRNRCEIKVDFEPKILDMAFSFDTASSVEVSVDKVPKEWEEYAPVFLPTRELLTIAPGFVSLYESFNVRFEETWRDTCLLLESPLAKGPRVSGIKPMLEPLEAILGGQVVLEATGFYLKLNSGKMEAYLVAEGLRKIAMLARLIATGSLADKGFLFWDEPEANLNPKVIKQIAKTILLLCRSGIQVFIASHSLFLLRELDILLKSKEYKDVPAHFIGLHPEHEGVKVLQGAMIEDIGNIDALDEELNQSNRYISSEIG